MNNLNFTVCSYNIGSGTSDYYASCLHNDSTLSFKSKEEEDAFRSQYKHAENKTVELLSDQAEVYCLQEVGEEERPIISSLKDKNFEIVHLKSELFDSAIALDKNRFKDINNHSISVRITSEFSKDVAIASAKDRLTGQRVVFVSAHVPGFDFSQVNASEAREGDVCCKAIFDTLSRIGSAKLCIVGADMNANPETWDPRFKVFANRKFQLHRNNAPTNVNPRAVTEQQREIDFVFTKRKYSLWQRIKSIFVSTYPYKTRVKKEGPLSWNVKENASDHLPVFVEISPKVPSKIRRLWNAASAKFRP